MSSQGRWSGSLRGWRISVSINMTQDFEFETDDLKSFRIILSAAVRVLFHEGKNGLWTQLHIQQDDRHHFPSGAVVDNHQRPMILPDGDQFKLVDPCETYHGTTVLSAKGVYSTKDEAAEAAKLEDKEPKATRVYIATLSDYESEIKPEDIRCKTYDELVDETMKIVAGFPKKKFFDTLGDGYNYWFNPYDGSVGVAYRMQWRPNGGWNLLHISMTHAYYEK